MTRRARRFAGVTVPMLLTSLMLMTSCAGPTYTDSAMRSQASRSASSAVSELETLRLAVVSQLSGDSWWQFTDVIVTDSESALSSIESTLSSRQPPTAGSAQARDDVVQALGDAVDLAESIRIAVRHDDESSLRRLLRQLPPLVSRLSHLSASLA
jgi:hypothetical protein